MMIPLKQVWLFVSTLLVVWFNARWTRILLSSSSVNEEQDDGAPIPRSNVVVVSSHNNNNITRSSSSGRHLQQQLVEEEEERRQRDAAVSLTVPPVTSVTSSTTSEAALEKTTSSEAAAREKTTTSSKSWRPTHEWLKQCAAELATNSSGSLVPFFSMRDGYGLGDCIKMCARCTLGKPLGPPKKGRGRRQKTLALRYKERACYWQNPNYVSGGNLPILEELLWSYGEKHNPPSPPEDAIVLHLRVGDVIEKSKQSTEEMLISGGNPFHTSEFDTSIKSVYEYLDNIESSGATSVMVIGGVFQVKHFEKSRVYAGCLERAFQRAGYSVTVNLDSGDADLDFYYMTKAKKFVVSAGGYSNLIGKLITRQGGVVIGRTFDDTEGAVKKYERKMGRPPFYNKLMKKHQNKNDNQ